MCRPKRPPPLVRDLNRLPRLRPIAINQIRSKYPRMPRSHTIRRLPVDADLVHASSSRATLSLLPEFTGIGQPEGPLPVPTICLRALCLLRNPKDEKPV